MNDLINSMAQTIFELEEENAKLKERLEQSESAISNLLKELNLRTTHMYDHPQNWPEVVHQWDKDENTYITYISHKN